MKTTTWFFSSIFVLLAFCILFSGLIYYQTGSRVILGDRSSELHSVVQLKADQIIQWREERFNDVEVHASSPIFKQALQGWLADPHDQQLKSWIVEYFQILSAHYDYDAVYLVDKDASMLLSSDEGLPESAYNQLLANQVLNSDRSIMGNFVRELDTGKITIDVGAPVKLAGTSEPFALIFRSNPMDNLFPGIQKTLVMSEEIDTALLRLEGQSVLILNRLRHDDATPMTRSVPISDDTSFAVQAVMGKFGSIHGLNLLGKLVHAEAINIPDSDWVVVSFLPEAEVYAEIQQLQISVGVFVLLSVVLTVVLAVYLYNRRQRKFYFRLLEAEREKTRTQQEIRATLYSIGDAVMTTDASGVVNRMNPVAERLTGWSEVQASGRPLVEVFHILNEFSREKVENPVERVLRKGQLVGMANHTLLVSQDGTERPIADSGAPIRDENGDVVGVVMVFRDQSDERQIQKERYRLTEAIRASLNEIYLFDAEDLHFLFVNDGALKNLGYTLDQMNAMTPLDINTEMPRETFLAILDSLRDGNEELQVFETLNLREDGSLYPVEVYLQFIQHANEKFFMAVIQDITQRKTIEQAIQFEQERNHILVELSPEAILMTRDEIVEYANPAAVKLFHAQNAEDLIGKDSISLYAAEFHDQIRERQRILLEEGGLVPLLDERIICFDGSSCDVEVATTTFTDLSGRAIQVTLRDISERKKTQQQIKEQLDELQRWHSVTLDREQRIQELKAEINALLVSAGKDLLYRITS